MYKRGKAFFKALIRVAGTGDNRKLPFLDKMKITHWGILVPRRRELVNDCLSKHIHCQWRHIWRKSKHGNNAAQIFSRNQPKSSSCWRSFAVWDPSPCPTTKCWQHSCPTHGPCTHASDPREESTVEGACFSAWFMYDEGGGDCG